MRKRWWIVGLVIIILAGMGYVGFGAFQRMSGQQAQAQSTSDETAVVGRGTLRVTIDGSGSLAPNDEVALAFPSAGRVAEVLAAVGDRLAAGDVIARLDDADAREAVTDAEFQVAQTEINLALARTEAALGVAQSGLDAAQASYDEATALANRTGDQLTATRVSLEQARDGLADAQEDYDSTWDQARDWELDVRGRKEALEAEREATEAALHRAQYDLEVAQANYNLAVAGLSEASERSARSQVLNAQVTLETEPLQLEQLALSLSQAQLKLDSARRTLDDTQLIAPMDGTVTELELRANEMANAGQAAVVLSDLATFVVEISLDETDVARVAVGQAVVVTLDAFPGMELTGEVIDIAPVADSVSGVVLYPVTVQLSPVDVPARAGMTADVEIVTASRPDALIVPLRAIQSEGGKSYVWRQSSDGFEKVEVALGMTTDTEVEITTGLLEGDVVSVVAVPQSSGQRPSGPMGMFGGPD